VNGARLPVAALALALLTVAVTGCVGKRQAAWQAPPPGFGGVSDAIVAGLVADGDQAWAARGDAKQLDEAARAWRAALRYRPDDPSLHVRLGRLALVRGRHLRGHAAVAAFNEATAAAERALAARNPRLATAAAVDRATPDAVFAHADVPDGPALALYAEGLLYWAIAEGTPTVIAFRARIEAAARRLLTLDRAVAWAGADRVLAILDCELPDAGANLRDALDRFEAARAAVPGYLPNQLAYAEEYALRLRERALYQRLLREIVAADAQALPEAAAENADAQRQARALLERSR
jgi:hypothetical protein